MVNYLSSFPVVDYLSDFTVVDYLSAFILVNYLSGFIVVDYLSGFIIVDVKRRDRLGTLKVKFFKFVKDCLKEGNVDFGQMN